MNACYLEMEDWGPTSPQSLAGFARKHLLLYKELHLTSPAASLWQFVPKHHLWLHCAEITSTNPRVEWNYCDEDEIGSAVVIGTQVNPAHVHTRLLERYAETMEFRD